MTTIRERRSNRVSINVEDVVYAALTNLADKEGASISELCRDILVSELNSLGLLPDESLRRMAGVRR